MTSERPATGMAGGHEYILERRGGGSACGRIYVYPRGGSAIGARSSEASVGRRVGVAGGEASNGGVSIVGAD